MYCREDTEFRTERYEALPVSKLPLISPLFKILICYCSSQISELHRFSKETFSCVYVNYYFNANFSYLFSFLLIYLFLYSLLVRFASLYLNCIYLLCLHLFRLFYIWPSFVSRPHFFSHNISLLLINFFNLRFHFFPIPPLIFLLVLSSPVYFVWLFIIFLFLLAQFSHFFFSLCLLPVAFIFLFLFQTLSPSMFRWSLFPALRIVKCPI